jgi:predicted glutamate--cysteine ligase
VTASTHINVGIPDRTSLMRACRVLRCEAALYLALTAASPFLDGASTGQHSTRWHLFPKTPARVPLFIDGADFVSWVEAQIEEGSMYNHRHLWVAVRPNGPASPNQLDRLELRICDRIADPVVAMAITALLEARIWQILEDEEIDPLPAGIVDRAEREERLLVAIDANEAAAAHRSLGATLRDWRTGKAIDTRRWLERYYEAALRTAQARGFAEHLAPVADIISNGNVAQSWLARLGHGLSPADVLAEAIAEGHELDMAACAQQRLEATTA